MKKLLPLFATVCLSIASTDAFATDILASYSQLAKSQNPNFSDFSAQAGEAFFLANHNSGKPETPSCTSCHSKDPLQAGQTRAGKTIAPLAKSVSTDRYTDPEKVEKWFLRNCNSVLGRECSPEEKGNFIAFMMTK